MLLLRAQGPDAIQLVVLASERDILATQQSLQDLHGLRHSGLSHSWWIEALSDRRVLRKGVSCADTGLQSAVAELIDACKFPRQMHGVIEIIVQH